MIGREKIRALTEAPKQITTIAVIALILASLALIVAVGGRN